MLPHIDIAKILESLRKRLDCQEEEINKLKEVNIKIRKKLLDKDIVVD